MCVKETDNISAISDNKNDTKDDGCFFPQHPFPIQGEMSQLYLKP